MEGGVQACGVDVGHWSSCVDALHHPGWSDTLGQLCRYMRFGTQLFYAGEG